MEPDFVCFVEQQNYDQEQVGSVNLRELFEQGLCKKRGPYITFLFTGFVVQEGKLVVVFPKGYKIPQEMNQKIAHTKVLANTLLRYREEKELTSEEKMLLFGGGHGGRNGIGAALWLIRDFITYGLVHREHKVKIIGNGAKIDWWATVKSIEPTVIKNQAHYLNFVVRKTNHDTSNKIRMLHQFAVQESLRLYGWLWGKGVEVFDQSPISNFFDERQIKSILQTEMMSTYNEREVRLFQMIRNFLVGSDQKEESLELETLATPYYYHVWEHICGYLFENQYATLKKYVPQPRWQWDRDSGSKYRKQIPDILYRYEGVLYIVDAKYYDTNKNLPGWHDLVKQFFYAYSMTTFEESYVNVFVFPSFSDSLLTHNGYADIQDRPDLGKIEAVSLNVFDAMEAYATRSLLEVRRALAELVVTQ